MENNITNDYNVAKGMAISELEEQIKEKGAPEETEQLLFDFCKNDIDKKITDDIELALVTAWQAGETKIEMPDMKSNESTIGMIVDELKAFFGFEKQIASSKKDDSTNEFSVRSRNGRDLNVSSLRDVNNDGYADEYNGTYLQENEDGSIYIKEVKNELG